MIRRTSFLRSIPILRRLHREVTARLVLLGEEHGGAPAFRLDFMTPYLHLPVKVDRSQFGIIDDDSEFRPEAFRFFDWQSWVHIGGEIDWHGDHEVDVNGQRVTLITGLTYRPQGLAAGVCNLGLRLVEGVTGTMRVLRGDAVVAVGFDPGYWMLEPGRDGFRVVAIRDNDLMVLIVSLSEIGSGNRNVYAGAVENLWQWVSFHCGHQKPETAMRVLLKYVHAWGPLGLVPLYGGLVEILTRLGVVGKEQILFDLFADHCGVRDNRNGRLLALRTLEALRTDASRSALRQILAYVTHRRIEPGELALIEGIVGNPKRSD